MFPAQPASTSRRKSNSKSYRSIVVRSFWWPRRRRRPPDGCIQVVPDDAFLGPNDPAPPAARNSKASSLEHPLVVRELEKIALSLPGGERIVDCCILEARGCSKVEQSAGRPRCPIAAGSSDHVVLDVDWPIAPLHRDHQHVWLTDTPALMVSRESTADNHRHSIPHCL